MTDIEHARDLLVEIAAGIARDIKGDYPGLDVEGMDLWLEDGIMTEIPSQWFAVIDMGDIGQWVYQLVEEDRYDKYEWVDVSGHFDPTDIKDRIIAKRTRNR